MKTLSTLILLLAALTTFARLGETKYQCEKRYGKPVENQPKEGKKKSAMSFNPSRNEYHYEKNGIKVHIKFDHRGRACWIKFSPIGTDEAVQSLLKANANKKDWKELSKGLYKRTDNKAYAKIEYVKKQKDIGKGYKVKFVYYLEPSAVILSTKKLETDKNQIAGTNAKKSANLSGF